MKYLAVAPKAGETDGKWRKTRWREKWRWTNRQTCRGKLAGKDSRVRLVFLAEKLIFVRFIHAERKMWLWWLSWVCLECIHLCRAPHRRTEVQVCTDRTVQCRMSTHLCHYTTGEPCLQSTAQSSTIIWASLCLLQHFQRHPTLVLFFCCCLSCDRNCQTVCCGHGSRASYYVDCRANWWRPQSNQYWS